MPKKVLLVEDDSSLSFVLKDALVHANLHVDHYYDGQAAASAFKSNFYDIAILDIMLPVLDGFNLARQLKQKDQELPIIFLTARAGEEDKIKGFDLGADDYLTKPFSVHELLARVKAILNRTQNRSRGNNELAIGSFLLDYEKLALISNDKNNDLTQREADLLLYFIEHENQLLKREDILKAIWGDDDYFMGRSLDVFISKIRKYLEADDTVQLKNHHGVGFMLKCEKR